MTEYEAVHANLMSLVRVAAALQKQVQSLENVCRIQDASILALNDRIEYLESKVHTLEFPLE